MVCQKSNWSVLRLVLLVAPVDKVKTDACIHSHKIMLLLTKDKLIAAPRRTWAGQVMFFLYDFLGMYDYLGIDLN